MSGEIYIGGEAARAIFAEQYLDEPEELRRQLELRGALNFTPYTSGLFPASSLSPEVAEATGMGMAWLRDNAHIANALMAAGQEPLAARVGQSVLAILDNNRPTLDGVVNGTLDPADPRNRLPVRVNGETLENDTEPRIQNDSVGYALWSSGRLMLNGSLQASLHDLETLAQTVRYLDAIKFWQDQDDSHWEEDRLVHMSSIGVVLAGLRDIQAIFDRVCYRPGIDFDVMVEQGQAALQAFRSQGLTQVQHAHDLLVPPFNPNMPQPLPSALSEASIAQHFLQNFDIQRRKYDASLLFLAEPLHILDDSHTFEVVQAIEQHLLRANGFARYEGDTYWEPRFKDILGIAERTTSAEGRTELRNLKAAGVALTRTEAQWTLFDPLLSVYWGRVYQQTGSLEAQSKQLAYLNRSLSQLVTMPDGSLRLPEAFYYEIITDHSGTKSNRWIANDHIPLLWSQANLLLALLVFEDSHVTQ
jgi:hypothetical protein